MGARTKGRKFLLQCRYASQINEESILWNLDSLEMSDRFESGIRVWITALAKAVEHNREEIDTAIGSAMKNWTISRLNVLTRLILEQAIAESWFMDIPVPVAIDEALKLAREFADQKAVGFINGVLDNVLTGERQLNRC